MYVSVYESEKPEERRFSLHQGRADDKCMQLLLNCEFFNLHTAAYTIEASVAWRTVQKQKVFENHVANCIDDTIIDGMILQAALHFIIGNRLGPD